MAESNKPVVVELGIESGVELLLFLYPYGAEQMNLPHNFFLGLACWVIGAAIAIRMLWIFPAWSGRLTRLEKGLIAFILVAIVVLMFYKPVLSAYRRRNVGESATQAHPQQPSEQQPPIQQSPTPPPSSSGEGGVRPIPKAKPPKQAGNNTVTNPIQPQPPSQVISAPNGIAIGGGTVSNPTVNNYNPPPNVTYKKTEGDGLAELQIWVDKPYPDAKFAVICDRPCKAVDGKIDWGGRHPGVTFSPEVEVGIVGSPGEFPNIAAFLVDHPAVFGTDISLKCTVKSSDGLPFIVTEVKTLNIKPKY